MAILPTPEPTGPEIPPPVPDNLPVDPSPEQIPVELPPPSQPQEMPPLQA